MFQLPLFVQMFMKVLEIWFTVLKLGVVVGTFRREQIQYYTYREKDFASRQISDGRRHNLLHNAIHFWLGAQIFVRHGFEFRERRLSKILLVWE